LGFRPSNPTCLKSSFLCEAPKGDQSLIGFTIQAADFGEFLIDYHLVSVVEVCLTIVVPKLPAKAKALEVVTESGCLWFR
jgi:hypothetical protein